MLTNKYNILRFISDYIVTDSVNYIGLFELLMIIA